MVDGLRHGRPTGNPEGGKAPQRAKNNNGKNDQNHTAHSGRLPLQQI
jgi:hypothetical protein